MTLTAEDVMFDILLDEEMAKNRRKKRRRKKMARKKKKSGRWRKVFVIHRGDLTSLGYHLNKSSRARHIALGKAVRKYGYGATMRKLAFLKGAARISKAQKRKVAADMRWLKEKYGKNRR